MQENQIQTILSQFDEKADEGQLSLKSINSLLTDFHKEININQSNQNFTVCRKAFSFWLRSSSSVNLVEIQLYEQLAQSCKNQFNLQHDLEQFNKEMCQIGFKEVNIQKITQILTQHKQTQFTLYELYKKAQKKQGEQEQEEDNKSNHQGISTIIDKGIIKSINQYLQKRFQEESEENTDKINISLVLGQSQWQNNASFTISTLNLSQTEEMLEELEIQESQLIFIKVQLPDPQKLKKSINNLSFDNYTIQTESYEEELIIAITSEDKSMQIIQLLRSLYANFEDIVGQDENVACDFGLELKFPFEKFQNLKTLLETVLQGFRLNLNLEIDSLIWKTIRKNIQLKHNNQIWLSLMKNTNLLLKFKQISQIQKFLTRLGLNKLVEKTPKIGDFMSDVVAAFSQDENMPLKSIISQILSQQYVNKLSVNAKCEKFGLGITINGEQIEELGKE